MFPQEGFRDLSRRLRLVQLGVAQVRLRRTLVQAETELGWMGWEQVDFFDTQISEEVRKVQEFEGAQASLMNTSAELSGRKAALDEELALEKARHDQAQAALAQEREPIAAQFDQAETARRQKLDASERFERALGELAQLEKQLEARSRSLMCAENPTFAIRVEAREISDQLARLPGERKLVFADKTNASREAARLEPGIAELRAELRRIDAAASAARDRLAAVNRRVTAEVRLLERERKKSKVSMSHLDREKLSPYRLIGACLADHGIAPLNQPQILDKVFALRERDAQLEQTLAELRAGCAAANGGMLVAFYLLLAAVFFVLFAVTCHLLH